MGTIDAHGIACSMPRGWDGQIYRRQLDTPLGFTISAAGRVVPDAVVRAAAPPPELPVVHLANFALPAERGDYGGGAVELMRSGGVFISLLEHPPEDATTQLFAGKSIPWPLDASSFGANRLQRNINPHGGHQSFFTVGPRPFCLYVVIGNVRSASLLAGVANEALQSIVIS